VLDVPGYGYAKVSKVQREKFGKMIEEYLTTRQKLQLVCVLPGCCDVRAIFFRPIILLINDDLPTFERPLNAKYGSYITTTW
jgi:hypothetical protein